MADDLISHACVVGASQVALMAKNLLANVNARDIREASVCVYVCVCVLWVCSLAQLCLTLQHHGLQPTRILCPPRQEYWSGLPFPSPGNFSDPGITPASLASPAFQMH